MERNPLQWTVSDVVAWLSTIHCTGAQEIFEYHNIEGKDLLQLTDNDLRFDFKIKRVHDRKYLLRSIQDLKNSHSAIIEVQYSHQHCNIRIPDISSYSFDNLRRDACRYFGLNAETAVVRDKKGVVWGSVGISCIFDSNLRQQEPVFIEAKELEFQTEVSRFQPSDHRSESPWINEEFEDFKPNPHKFKKNLHK